MPSDCHVVSESDACISCILERRRPQALRMYFTTNTRVTAPPWVLGRSLAHPRRTSVGGLSEKMAGPSTSTSTAAYEQELQLEKLFHGLSAGFQKLDKLAGAKQAAMLKDLTADMQEAKT